MRPVTLKTVEQNLRGKLAYLPGLVSPGWVESTGGLLVVDTDLPSDTFNVVAGATDDAALVEALAERFRRRRQPVAWWYGVDERAAGLEALLARSGLVFDEEHVAMAIDLATAPSTRATAAAVSIRRADDAAGCRAFGDAVAAAFPEPDAAVAAFYRRLGAVPSADRSRAELLVGELDGEPVCTASLHVEDDVFGVYDMATRADRRGAGLGTAMLAAALEAARARGLRHGLLQASGGAERLYARLGFAAVGRVRTFSNRAHLI